MAKSHWALLIVLLASSLALVKSAYESRRVFAELDKARQEQRRLDADYKRLDAERQAQGTHLRVEKVARDKLRMSTATPGVTAYVDDTVASAPVGAPLGAPWGVSAGAPPGAPPAASTGVPR